MGDGSNANCFALRRESKGAALYEFACACEAAPQGEYREPGLQAFYVSKMTGRQSLYWAFFIGIFANKNALVGTTTACCSVRD